jgi:hypothetical protein
LGVPPDTGRTEKAARRTYFTAVRRRGGRDQLHAGTIRMPSPSPLCRGRYVLAFAKSQQRGPVARVEFLATAADTRILAMLRAAGGKP